MREDLKKWKVRQYYEKEEVQERILDISEYREVVPTYENTFGRRPDTINFKGDLDEFIENGAISFHGSVEKWRNPLLIDKTDDNDSIRKSWDLVIDIDCDESIELAKKTSVLVKNSLESYGIESIGLKFSGNRGFHLVVPDKAFPDKVNSNKISQTYPRLPRAIINLIRKDIRSQLTEEIKSFGYENEIKTKNGYNPFLVSDVENNWGDRHLFRLPYSIHDGSGLVSIPLEFEELDSFERSDAAIEAVECNQRFIPDADKGEAFNLVVQAMDMISQSENNKDSGRKSKNHSNISVNDLDVDEDDFPPTIENILDGLEDGRKRGLFILINFFDTLGFEWEWIEDRIWVWNQENKEPLPETYVRSQLSWHKSRDETVPPPNYDSDGYYKDMQVYEGDNLEERVSNPVAYVMKKNGAKNKSRDKRECPYCGKEFGDEQKYKDHVQTCFEK